MASVNFIIGDVTIETEFLDTPTARKILDELPITANGSYWGEEFYFGAPVHADEEPDATDVVDPGTVAFWTAGNCLCLFWGPTPASQGSECRAASNVNIVGEVVNKDDLQRLRGRTVRVERG